MKSEPFDIDLDFDACVNMARRMHSASIFNALEFSVAKIMTLFIRAHEHNGDPYFFHVVRDSKPIAMFLGVAGSHFCSEDTYAIDQIIWVDPEYRGTGAGRVLVDKYKEWCLEMGVTLPMIGSSTGINIEKTKAFYESCGFECVGHNFVEKL